MSTVLFAKTALAIYGLGAVFVLALLLEVWNTDKSLLLASLSQHLVVEEINAERRNIGLSPLRVSAALQQASQLKAEDMVAQGYFSHQGPNGEEAWVWLDRVGYSFAGAAENLAIDVADSKVLVQAWLHSPNHAKQLQNPDFREVGIGFAEGIIDGRETRVAVAFLGWPLPSNQILSSPTVSNIVVQEPEISIEPIPPREPLAMVRVEVKDTELNEPLRMQVAGSQLSASRDWGGIARLLLSVLYVGLLAWLLVLLWQQKKAFALPRIAYLSLLLLMLWSSIFVRESKRKGQELT